MNIGIDIDNVISNFNEVLLDRFLKHDKTLRNTGILNNEKYITEGMFDWTEEELKSFYDNIIEDVAVNLDLINDSKKYIDKLKSEGYKIYIITGRDNGEYKDPYNMTVNWLNNHGIYYDKLILTNAKKYDKYLECKNNDIDIFIDDSKNMCDECTKNGVHTLLFSTPYNKDNSNLTVVEHWEDIYNYIKKYKMKVILDTDTYNECDDQFALAYLLKSRDKFDINAITIAPYSNKVCSIKDGLENSYKEVLKISNFLNIDTKDITNIGSDSYLGNNDYVISDASKKIIDIALKNEKTYIIAIGALTNVASAIKIESKIIKKIEVIWLGGHDLEHKDNLEFNFMQDIKAVKTVFESGVKLTILPCENVVRKLQITVDELDNKLIKNELNTYLIERFTNDGYHGKQYERPIWDISAVAYLINRDWFKIKKIHCPNINDDSTYELNQLNYKINYVSDLNREEIYNDLFEKLNKCNEVEGEC